MTTREQYISKLERLLQSDYAVSIRDVIDSFTTSLISREPKGKEFVKLIATGETFEVLDSYTSDQRGSVGYICAVKNSRKTMVLFQDEVELSIHTKAEGI